jgi:hypothetical protein
MRRTALEFIHARCVENDCLECLSDFLTEVKSLGGLPLEGRVVIIPKHWLNWTCIHGRRGLKFEEVADSSLMSHDEMRAKDGDIEFEAPDSRIDATKGIGYPVREHGPYGSHPMHDDFDDESSPDGSGTY